MPEDADSETLWSQEFIPRFGREHHVSRHDPARVLAECAAKRAIVKWAVSWPVRPAPANEGIAAMNNLLRLLAQPYRGAEGWRDEWDLAESPRLVDGPPQ